MIAIILGVGLFGVGCRVEEKAELVLFCAAGMKVPMSQIAADYEAETGVAIRLQFAGSGTLLGNLRVAPGDLYLAADASYIEEAKRYGLLTETFEVAQMAAGLAVPRGNPLGLTGIDDLINNPKLRCAVGNPDAASIGRFTKTRLAQQDLWQPLKPKVMLPTVNELANAIELGSIDAGIVWDAVVYQYPNIDFIPLSEFAGERVAVTIGVTQKVSNRELALKFCRYLIAADKGQVVFRQAGYTLRSIDAQAG